MAEAVQRHASLFARLSRIILAGALVAACGAAPPSAASSPSSLLSVAASAGSTGTPALSPTLTTPGNAARLGGWSGDLDLLVPGIERLHPDPFHSTPKSELLTAVAALRVTIPTASDDELMVGVDRIVAMVSAGGRDAHTGLFPWGGGTFPTHTLPLRLWRFPTGFVIVDARPPYESLIGRALASIDGHPIDEVVAALDPLVPRDNPETVTLLLPRYLLTTEILHGSGLADGTAGATLEFADALQSPVAVEAIDTRAYNDWATSYGLFLPPRGNAPYLARSGEPLWFERDGTTLVVGYNRVTRLPAADLAGLTEALSDPAIRRVIVDIRNNYGGETSGYPPVADALVANSAAWTDGLFLVTGRNTFSAASLFAASVTSRARVIVVGEPMGGSPSLFGDARDLSLPYSGLTVSVATEYYEVVPGDDRTEITPDLPVSLSAGDYFAGRDAAREAIDRRRG